MKNDYLCVMNKRAAIYLALLVTAIFGLSSCNYKSLKDIKVTSCDITSISPKGLSAFDATVDLGVDNPSVQFSLSKMNAVVKMQGEPCMYLTADDVTVAPRQEQVYTLVLHGSMADGFNPFSLLNLLKEQEQEPLTIDVSYRGNLKSGLGKNFEYKDISLKDLIGRL